MIEMVEEMTPGYWQARPGIGGTPAPRRWVRCSRYHAIARPTPSSDP